MAETIASFSKEFGIDKHIVSNFWRFAKKQYGSDHDVIVTTVKRMIKNYKKFKLENKLVEDIIMNNIDMTLLALEEGCGCGGDCGKKDCKCKKKDKKKGKKKGAPLTGNELKSLGKFTDMIEGKSKRALEDRVEKACTCDGGASLSKKDHDKDCPAQKIIDGDF